jgi:hypothetical protein
MKYLQGSFSISPGGTKEYRDNYDRIFGKKEQEPQEQPVDFEQQVKDAIKQGIMDAADTLKVAAPYPKDISVVIDAIYARLKALTADAFKALLDASSRNP